MLHVGMNIRDNGALFAEIHRLMKPDGTFTIFDVMRKTEDGQLAFPVPWASQADISFVESAATYRGLLEQSGFVV
jgi:hypothetical protein